MDALVRQVFRRLQTLDPAEEEQKLALSDTETSGEELKMSVQTDAETAPQLPSDDGLAVPPGRSAGVDGTTSRSPRSPDATLTKVYCEFKSFHSSCC